VSTATNSVREMSKGEALTMSGCLSPLLAIAPGPTRVLTSSSSLSWQGILIERHLSSPGQRAGTSIDRHVLSMPVGSSSRFDYRRPSGEFTSTLNRPGTIMITPAGPVPDMHLHEPSELVHCALDESFTRDVVHDLGCAAAPREFRAGIQERSIQRILGLLVEELESKSPLGTLYVDSLAQALVTRYVLLERTSPCLKMPKSAGLLPRILNRIREKIEANLDADLSLQSLAEESGYSRAHFLRLFREATGVTPHQYVLSLRLKRAQDQLRQKGPSIVDVAASCGFSSQSHMTSLFRQRLEMTPGEYRRSA